MGARAFDWLPALVEHRARVVFKTKLVDLDWPGVVVEEKNLLVHISCLRKVFELQTIATITERGNLLTAAFDGAAPGAAVAAAPSPCPTPASGDETAAYLLNLSIMFVPPPATSKVSRCTTALGHQIPQLAVPQWVDGCQTIS